MKIAVIGAGNVGATLGRRFVEFGHAVTFGVPRPDEYKNAQLPGSAVTVREAAADADLVVLAVPYSAAASVISECGGLAGKIVIDATNPLAMGPEGLYLTIGFDDSAAEQIAKTMTAGHLVKCFNSTGYDNMANPRGSMMFVCGDHAESNETVRALADEIGFKTMNIGGLKQARLLEPLAMLWIHLAFTTDLRRDFAFKISTA